MVERRQGVGRNGRGWNDARGFYTIILAIVLPLFVGMLGLALDISHYWWAQSQLQNAADAAAFAGAKDLNSTGAGRVRATAAAASYATRHKVDGTPVLPAEVIENVTGNWNFNTRVFTSANVSDASANAIRVTVQRADVPTFFSKFFATARSSETLKASAIAVAGGARSAKCIAPIALASCALTYDSAGKLSCPTNLSFQNGFQSVGLTLPDGSDPVNGNRVDPFVSALMADPEGCPHPAQAGMTLNLQNGNDLAQSSVNTINAATQNGQNPVAVVLPVVDKGPSCPNGANYNQSAPLVGFLKMKVVGARWTESAFTLVASACPGLGKKNVCVQADCSLIDAPAGSTIGTKAEKVYLVN